VNGFRLQKLQVIQMVGTHEQGRASWVWVVGLFIGRRLSDIKPLQSLPEWRQN